MTADEMKAWLLAAGARSSCTFCGKNAWVSHENINGNLQRFRVACVDDDGNARGDGLVLVAIACGNCGHMAAFSHDVLTDLAAMVPDYPPES